MPASEMHHHNHYNPHHFHNDHIHSLKHSLKHLHTKHSPTRYHSYHPPSSSCISHSHLHDNVNQHHRPHTGDLTSWSPEGKHNHPHAILIFITMLTRIVILIIFLSPDTVQWQRECGGEIHSMAERTLSERRTKVDWTRRRRRWGPMERVLTSWEEWMKREWTSWSEHLLITSQSPAHLPGNYFPNHVLFVAEWFLLAKCICRWVWYIFFPKQQKWCREQNPCKSPF